MFVDFPHGVRLCMLCFVLAFGAVLSAQNENDLTEMSLDELLNLEVSVASNVVTENKKQPVSVTTISRKQIELSGARTLSEVILTYVPGYFLVEDQDDVIAGFRGFSPDNNSKVMLLLNGQNLNTEWFWGPADSILNGIALDYIERIEVIRGPGSVTQGQGALLGVINIVTKDGSKDHRNLSVGVGEDGYARASWLTSYKNRDLNAFVYATKSEFDGQPLRREGWAAERFDQGLFVADRGHRLKRSDNTTFLANLESGNWRFNFLHTEQKRDLYNFFRDREEVEHKLFALNASYETRFNEHVSLKVKGRYEDDDFSLLSHSGFTLGGTKETRHGLKVLGNFNYDRLRFALGGEYNRYESGKHNDDNNNFIVNAVSSIQPGLDETNTWVFRENAEIESLFGEAFFEAGAGLDLFAAFRYDSHTFWGDKVTPRLGALYEVSDRLLWRFTWQTGFRGAVGVHYSGGFLQDGLLREENFSQIEANPLLAALGDTNVDPVEPEEVSSFEVAMKYQGDARFVLDVVGFYNVMDNVIDVGVIWHGDNEAFVNASPEQRMVGTDLAGDWHGFWFFKNNDGKIKQWGTEISAVYQPDQWSIGFSHALVQVDDADAGQFGGSMYIAGTQSDPHFKAFPENVTRINVAYSPKDRVSLAANYLYYWKWYSPDGSTVDGNHLLNLAGSYNFGRFEVRMQIKNVLDQDKLYPMNNNAGNEDLTNGTPALESRTIWADIRWNF